MLISIPGILDWPDLKSIRAAMSGGAFVDGRRTAGYRAKRVKNNLQMEAESEYAKAIKDKVLDRLRRNSTFQRAILPKRIRPPLISRYSEGMNYGRHVDDAMMGGNPKVRSDVSVTVFLSDPADYQGGELIMETPFGDQEVKLPAGTAVVYPSSTLHRVAPVTGGERLAAVTWAQSYIRDAARRELLYDLYLVREKMAKLDPDSTEADLAFKTYANLLRMWSD